jgi:ABC-type phosphate transport system auxiliary subunit
LDVFWILRNKSQGKYQPRTRVFLRRENTGYEVGKIWAIDGTGKKCEGKPIVAVAQVPSD